MMHTKEPTLTKKERAARDAYLASLRAGKRKTKKPLIVGMVGLVASGKSSVAKELAAKLGATIVSGDMIRLFLRKQNAPYQHVDVIGEQIARQLIQQGANSIIDSDFIAKKHRDRFNKATKAIGARMALVHVTCNIDIALGRAITAAYRNHPDDFFGGASSTWTDHKTKGAVVKIRELWRRTPLHYTWTNHELGQWTPKKLPFTVFAHIDTTNPKAWKPAVAACARKLLARS